MADAPGDLEASLARTARKYDLLPYESKPFPQSQPARLAGIARIFGLQSVPLDSARVLELGCASGGNIIPHAARYPNARFVGIDLGKAQVAAGRTRIEFLGLKNIELLCGSFTEIGEEIGSFDYIICHGVFSWVPSAVQDAICSIIRQHLSPLGIACVSYNVLPGWRMMQPIRDVLLQTLPETDDLRGRTAKARELLAFLASACPDNGPYGQTLRNWNERLTSLPDDYLCHEFLEECNEPTTVGNFVAGAARHGLGYLGDCEFAAMIVDNYPADVAAGVRTFGGNDLVANEQWLDALSGRTFRQSLLVSGQRMASVNRALGPDCVSGLHLVLPMGSTFARLDGEAKITLPDNRTISTRNIVVAEVFEIICAAQPGSASIDALLSSVPVPERGNVAEALYSMVIGGIAAAQSEPAGCSLELGPLPKASLLARGDARAGLPGTTNLRHEYVTLDPSAAAALPHLDGARSQADLVNLMVASALEGQISYAREGQPVSGEADLRAVAAEHLPEMLAGIARAGLLEG